VRREYQDDLTAFAAAMSRQDVRALATIRAEILRSVQQRGPFAYVEVSAIQSGAPESALHVTIDIVEAADTARRMPFRGAPSARFPDPDGLLAGWTEYERRAFPLAMAGSVKMEECPVLHCLYSFRDPALAPFLTEFNAGVREHKVLLMSIAESAAEPEHRKAAVYLLAHSNDVAAVLQTARQGIYDSSPLVRNAVMRVLMNVIAREPDREYPLNALVAAMDFPTVADRNKAAWCVAKLAQNSKHREVIRATAVPTTLRLLRLEQPLNHDPAYEILKLISGEAYGGREYAAWERWAGE
jgi:hypothetical protein